MKKFVIAIEEMIVENFEIEVENSEEAFEIAQRRMRRLCCRQEKFNLSRLPL